MDETRITQLETRLAQVEARLAALESRGMTVTVPGALPVFAETRGHTICSVSEHEATLS